MDFCHPLGKSSSAPSCSRNNSSSFPLGTLTWFSAPVPSPPKFGVVCARVGSNFLACLTSRSSGPRRKRLVRLASFVRRARPKPILKLIWSSFGLSPRMVLQLLKNGVIACSAPFGPWISAILWANHLPLLHVHAITPVLSLWARSPGSPLPYLRPRNSALCVLGWVPTSWRA